jgi:hypothetical protein
LFEQIPSPDSSCSVVGVMLASHYIEDVLLEVVKHNEKEEVEVESTEHVHRRKAVVNVDDDSVGYTDLSSRSEGNDSGNVPRKRSRISSKSSDNLCEKSVLSSALTKFSQWLLTHTHVSVLEEDLLKPFVSPNGVGSDTLKDEEELGEKEYIQLTHEDVQALRMSGFLQERVGSLGTATLSSSCKGGALYSLSHPRVSIFLVYITIVLLLTIHSLLVRQATT